jgi:hypothetical protein
VISAVSAGMALLAPNQSLNEVVDGLAQLLERAVDTDDLDTARGKAAFIEFAMGLAGDTRPPADGV